MNRRLRMLLAGRGGPARRGRGGRRPGRRAGPARRRRGATRPSSRPARPAGRGRRHAAAAARPAGRAASARSRELIASALAARDQDPSLAKLLAVEAMRRGRHADLPVDQRAPPGAGRRPGHRPLQLAEGPARGRAVDRPRPRGPAARGIRTGRGLAVRTGSATSHLEVADARTGTVLWSWPHGDVSATSGDGFIGPSWFSADGTQVIAGLYWGDPDTRAAERGRAGGRDLGRPHRRAPEDDRRGTLRRGRDRRLREPPAGLDPGAGSRRTNGLPLAGRRPGARSRWSTSPRALATILSGSGDPGRLAAR